MGALELVADRQSTWSATANHLKRTLDRTRLATFVLSILGALFAAIASQLADGPRWYMAMLSAALLAVATFLASRFLATPSYVIWVRARAAGEALKREAFKFASRAAPYDDPAARDALLNAEREKIENDVDDLLDKVVRTGHAGISPRTDITPAEYIARRIKDQVETFYEPRAERFRGAGVMLGRAELLLSLAATLITAVVGAMPKDFLLPGFDFVALTAVLTTIGGAILTHIEASRYHFLTTAYRATARRLRNELGESAATNFAVPSAEWSAFVGRCETIISEENNNWVAKWSKAN